MDLETVPEVNISEVRIEHKDTAAAALTGNTQTDLRAIAAELGVTLDAQGNVAEAATPAPVVTPKAASPAQTQPQVDAQPTTTEEPTVVPDKFLNPDGTPNEEKLAKSTASLAERVAQFRALEREHSQVQNRVNNPAPVNAAPAPAAPQIVSPVPLSQLEIAMANDLLSEAAAQGFQLDQRLAIAQARVMARGLEAKHTAGLADTQDIRQQLADERDTRNLQTMLENEPDLLTPGMEQKLMAVRQANPWLEKAPNPYQAAYQYAKGSGQLGSQVQTPTPKGQTAKAPPTPVGPVARVQSSADLSSRSSIEALSDKALNEALAQAFKGNRTLKI